jgi:hypothetical protein
MSPGPSEWHMLSSAPRRSADNATVVHGLIGCCGGPQHSARSSTKQRVLQRLRLLLAVLLPLASTAYLRVLAIAPLAYLATALFVSVLAAAAVTTTCVPARAPAPIPLVERDIQPRPATDATTDAAGCDASLEPNPQRDASADKDAVSQRARPDCAVYCVLGLYLLGNALLLGVVLWFNYRVGPDLEHDLTQAAVGAVSDSTARIWARAPHDTAAICVVATGSRTSASEDRLPASARGWSAVSVDADGTAVVSLSGLEPSTAYAYTATACAADGTALPGELVATGTEIDRGSFRTFASSVAATTTTTTTTTTTEPAQVRFAMGSCTMIGRTVYRELLGIQRMHDAHPDFYLFLGDAIYADVPKVSQGLGSGADALPQYHAMYRETFGNRDFSALRRAVPGFYQIDDHE